MSVRMLPVLGFPDYRVDELGNIYRARVGQGGYVRLRRVKPTLRNDGACAYVTLANHKEGTRKCARVHRVVLSTFIGPCPPGMECDHKDGNPANNRLDNLQWVNHTTNMANPNFLRRVSGDRNYNAKLTWPQVRAIRGAGATCMKEYEALAAAFGVALMTLYNVVKGKTWKHDPELVQSTVPIGESVVDPVA